MELGEGGEQVGQLTRPLVVVEVAVVHELGSLLAHHPRHALVSVPERVDGNPAAHVEVGPVLGVVEVETTSAGEDDWWACVCVENTARVAREFVVRGLRLGGVWVCGVDIGGGVGG